MLEDEWSHSVRMALGADGELAGGCPHLVTGLRAVRIMAVAALHQPGIDAVTEGPGELRFLGSMTSEAELSL